MEAPSTVVIKVKYGDMLRRFNAQIVDDELNLNMDGLRSKILFLFKIAPESELILTYIDEDGDVVTLVDADDLRDVVKQSLNPLRITVKLNSEKKPKQFSYLSGSSTPLRSPRVQEPSQNLHAGVSEILKTVPEPLRDTVVKLYSDLASKASSSAPGITELVNHFSKVGLSYVGQPSRNSDVPESSSGATKTQDSDLSKEKAAPLKVPSSGREDQSKNNESLVKVQTEIGAENIKVKLTNVAGGNSNAVPLVADSRRKEQAKKKVIECMEKKFGRGPSDSNNILIHVENEVEKPMGPQVGPKTDISAPEPMKGEYLARGSRISPWGSPGSIWAPNHGGSSFPGLFSGPRPTYDCPFSGIPIGNTSSAMPHPVSDAVPFKRSSSQNDSNGLIFHRRVRCDGCGVHPITGPRFKSKVKVDYDLCSICFSKMGNESDYIRMDRPAVSRHFTPLKGLYDSNQAPIPPQVCSRGVNMKSPGLKLDSRFIQDVNVLDGTILAPLSPFTKIWRMRNNGMVVWPPRTQLVWIGGDKLSNQSSVEVEISAAGLPVDQEIDVAVDFIAPEHPGRYISYWRMASPSGQYFGQRVWVLIQVDASRESIRGLNLNLPPLVGSWSTGPPVINVEAEPIVADSHPEPDNSKKRVELVEPVVDFPPINEQDMQFPINDSLLVGAGAPPFVAPQESAPVAPSSVPMAGVYASEESSVELPAKEEVEEKLLRELEEMGFKQVDLNKEVLRMNEYDLEQAVDDLCGVAEWDPILEELQEMGFHDNEVNKMLLKKNNGSIKRVVMDLIAGEKI